MKEIDLIVWAHYYTGWLEMEYIWFLWYNHLFEVKNIDWEIIKQYWSVWGFYETEKDMMFAMYWNHLKNDIEKLKKLKEDRKEYKDEIVNIMTKISKDMSDNMLLKSLVDKSISNYVAIALWKQVQIMINKYIKTIELWHK